MNLLLLESNDRLSENYILPKSLCVCMISYQAGDKELGGVEVQEGEAKEQGQATLEEEPQEAKAKKIQASGRGTTALAAVLPPWPRYYRATVLPPVLPPLLPRATEGFTVVAAVLALYYRPYYRGQQKDLR